MIDAAIELAAMRRALVIAADQAEAMRGNPKVGCVLLAPTGQVIAEAAHRGAGHPHAEVAALSLAKYAAVGATAVVTLEPCAHYGRTGPCASALRDAGVARVVYGQADSSVASGGATFLREAGIDVIGGVLADAAAGLNPEWTRSLELRRPFVTWKSAITLDGHVAAVDGTSRWITSEPARDDVQRLRCEVDSIMVGTQTVVADNPHLTIRRGGVVDRGVQPLRVVVGHRTLPNDAHVFDDTAETVQIKSHDPVAVLTQLSLRGRHHVLLEGGQTLAAAFVAAGVVDRVIAYVAPKLCGSGVSMLSDIGVNTMSQARSLVITDSRMIGPDVRLQAEFIAEGRA